jgi:uroporphyrinogen decarboxylase
MNGQRRWKVSGMDPVGPDFDNRLRRVLLCDSIPDRVPILETGIYTEAKERFLGRQIRSLRDEAEFWARAGYDAFAITSGIRQVIDPAIHAQSDGQYWSVDTESQPLRAAEEYAIERLRSQRLVSHAGSSEHHWAASREGIIGSDKEFDEFPWPRPTDLDFSALESATADLPPGMKIIPFSGQVVSPVYLMMGFENFYIKLALSDPLIDKMFHRIGEFSLKVVDILLQYDCVGAIWVNDDMGGSTNTLISPNHYRKLSFPWYERIAEKVHSKNLPLMLHSDGCIYSILGDLVRIGFDAIHPIEPKAMDIHRVRQIVGPDICLIGNVDLAFPLSMGRPEDVEAAVKDLIWRLAPAGGYCVSSANSIPDYVPYDNWLAMRNAVLRYGVYPIGSSAV